MNRSGLLAISIAGADTTPAEGAGSKIATGAFLSARTVACLRSFMIEINRQKRHFGRLS
jgi:hypothetical protein